MNMNTIFLKTFSGLAWLGNYTLALFCFVLLVAQNFSTIQWIVNLHHTSLYSIKMVYLTLELQVCRNCLNIGSGLVKFCFNYVAKY